MVCGSRSGSGFEGTQQLVASELGQLAEATFESCRELDGRRGARLGDQRALVIVRNGGNVADERDGLAGHNGPSAAATSTPVQPRLRPQRLFGRRSKRWTQPLTAPTISLSRLLALRSS